MICDRASRREREANTDGSSDDDRQLLMANYNRIILVGNLTRDPQLKYLPSQLPVVEFGMAVNHKFKTRDGQDRDEVLFIDCACFGKGAEVINNYCHKGGQLLVEG